jgi:hypothetical protein
LSGPFSKGGLARIQIAEIDGKYFIESLFGLRDAMANLDVGPLFAGTDDEGLLFALRRMIRSPRNDAQRTFCIALDATELLNGDGFEILFEQTTSLEEYAAAFAKIGMPQVQPIFDRVLALIPPDLRMPKNEEALFDHLRGQFDDLKGLAYEFYRASKDVVSTLARYVRAQQGDFSEYLGRSATG